MTFQTGWRASLIASAGLCAMMSAASPAVAQSQVAARSVDEVIVTARKRDERLQDVPIAVTALSSRALEGQQIRNLEDVTLASPNVYITRAQSSNATAQIYIRGAGQDDTFANVEPAIGLYVDGVPYTKAIGALIDVIDLESIEVLRGPQGTLYGRNSTGGAIKFETRRPDLNDSRFLADATIGSFARTDFRMSYSTPLATGLAAKLDVVSRQDNGYVTDARATPGSGRERHLNRTDRQSGKVSLLWKPTDRLEVYASADVTRDRSGPQSGTPFVSGAPADNLNGRGQISRSAPQYGVNQASPEILGPNTFDGRGGQVTVSYDLGGVTLKSVNAYRGFDYDQGIDTNGGPAAVGFVSQNGVPITRASGNNLVRYWTNETYTSETTLSSTGAGPLKWTAGVFLLHGRDKSRDYFGSFITSASGFDLSQTTDSAAAFGELSYTVLTNLEITAGGRYTYDSKDFFRDHFAAFGLPVFSGAPYSGSTSKHWSEFTPRLTADYHFSPGISAYVSYAKGFQAGAFQSIPFASAASSNTPYAPTLVENYEGGLRTQWLENRLSANLTVYQADYTDIPSSVLTTAGGFTILTNDVRVKGVEIEVAARPVSGLNIYASLATLNDKYTRSVLAPSAAPGSNGRNHLKFTPKATAKVGGQYDYELPNRGIVSFGGNVAYSGQYWMNAVNTPFGYQGSYAIIDANVAYAPPGERWKLTFAGKNLGNKRYAAQAATGAGGEVFFGPPKTWSLTLSVKN